MKDKTIEQAYGMARDRYAALGVDVDRALQTLRAVPVSMHCWQGDDITGFDDVGGTADSGLAATGNYPGKPRTADELRSDLEEAYSLIPGRHRVNLHAIYAETGGKKVERDELEFAHFAKWVEWARGLGLGMDFNPSFFAHPKASSGFTLSSRDKGIRRYWIGHGVACRRIGAEMGRELGSACINNVWIPDGYKDTPADRLTPRELLKDALDEVFAEELDPAYNRDSLEGKLFGLGSESYVVGSHDFYLAYAVSRRKMVCLDTGHYHPTESVSDKLSAVLSFVDEVMLHVSRGIRWDSDHVTTLSDELRSLAEEVVRGDFLGRAHFGTDFFDASINRVAAWVIGMRSLVKGLMLALVEPIDKLRDFEVDGDWTARLALLEEAKTLPFGAVWDYYCASQDVPVGMAWVDRIKQYEQTVLARR